MLYPAQIKQLFEMYSEKYTEDNKNNEKASAFVRNFLLIMALTILISIALLIWSIVSIFRCQSAGKWNGWVSAALVVSLFMPYIGLPIAIGMIIYAQVVCRQSAEKNVLRFI